MAAWKSNASLADGKKNAFGITASRASAKAGKGVVGWLTLLLFLIGAAHIAKAQTFGCSPAMANDIVCENSKPGNPPSNWAISGAGDSTIQGFATDMSVAQGSTVFFKINTTAAAYKIDIYRLGYYAGNGARKIASISPSVPLPQSQPPCRSDANTNLYDCGTWAVSASWQVPANATSGIYFALLTRTDTGGVNQVFFIVRNDLSHSDMLFQTNDETWQAYNAYGGHSLYGGADTWDLTNRAYKVSYNRPFITRGFSSEASTFVFGAEYPMIRWLEANGYDVTYFTGMDAARNGSLILNHKIYLDSGHDEYWSGPQRANVEAARNAGVNLAFFSGNEIFWKTRWENSIDGTSTAYRTLTCYKETLANAVLDPADPPTWTGTWRDPRFSPPADGGRPENALSGTIFAVNGPGTDNPGNLSILVPAADGKMRFWRNTSIASLSSGQTATLPQGSLGYEWDEDLDNGTRPAGLFDLSTATYSMTTDLLLDYGGTYGAGSATHHMTLYRAPSGALVFGAGTVDWAWGLDANHDNPFFSPNTAADPRMQQATLNLFADMGVQPATLQAGLALATKSTDTVAPTSTITSPLSGATEKLGVQVTITGTATDTGGGVVGGVEISTDGGQSWHPTIGRGSWSYNWTPLVSGSINLLSRAVDDSGNLETPSAGVTVTVPKTPVATDVQISGDTSSPSSTVSTPIFSTSASNELLLAFVATDYLSGANTTVTSVTGGGLTWVLVVRTNAQLGSSEIWRAFAPSPVSNMSVTANLSQSVIASLSVMSFTGVNTSGTNGSGAIGAVKSASASSGAPTATLVTTQANSVVVGVGNDYDNAIARTPGSGQTVFHQYLTPTGDTYWMQRLNLAVPLSGTSATINDTAPTGDRYNLSICEVLASTTQTLSISGTISPASSGSGTQMFLGGSGTAVVTADGSGNYTFANLTGGTYTVTPVKTGYTFTPASLSISLAGSNVTGANFTATASPTYSVSGNISPSAAGSGASVSLVVNGEGGSNQTVIADSSGNFTFTGVLNGSYTITPVKTGYAFSPVNQTISVAGANVSGVSFTGSAIATYTISGAISTSTAGSGTTLTLAPTGSTGSSQTTIADSTGSYSFAGVVNGTYSITPSKTGFTFSPASQSITVNGANISGINFAAQAIVTSNIRFIQKNVNGNEATAASISTTFPANNTAGDFLIVSGDVARPAGPVSISDTLGNTYIPAMSPVSDPNQNVTTYLWYVPSCKGGANTVTLIPSTAAALEIHVSEWSGVSATNPVDKSASATGNSASVSSGAATTTANGELIYGYTFLLNTASAGTGFTSISLVNGDMSEYELQPAAGSIAATFTQTSGYWLALMATFRPSNATQGGISGTISPVSGGSGATVTLSGPVTATATSDSSGNYSFVGLPDGTYTVTPTKSGVSFTPATQSVTVAGTTVTGVNFTANLPVLSVSPTGLFFAAVQGGGNPPTSTVNITNTGGGSFTYTASSDSAWLNATPAIGSAPQQLQVSATINGLAIGSYTGHITITSAGVQGSPAVLTVTLDIGVATDWLTVDHDASRSGNAVDETTINASNVGSLQMAWSTAVDASVTAQPLYVHGISIAGQTRDILIVGTGGNSLYALDALNGAVLWKRNFGAPTPNTWGLPDGFGIEAPPFIDRVAGRIYTVSTDGYFRVISLFDGTDVYPALALIVNPDTNKVWGGLNRVGNSIYIASGSNGGDVAPWRGQVYKVDISSTPTVTGDFVVVPSIPPPNGGGGIWGYGGVSADLATGNIYAASANDSVITSSGTEGYTPYSDSMIALDSSLNLLGTYQPVQPSTYACSGAPCDLDFASTPTFFQPPGCPTMVTAGNKDGRLFLFRTADLMVSGQPLQTLTLNTANDSLGSGGVGGVPAYSPTSNMIFVTTAGSGVIGVAAGVVALQVTSSCTLQVAWSKALGGSGAPNSTPTLANGLVFAGEGNTGIIHAYSQLTGNEVWHNGTQYGASNTFAAPIVAGGKVYAGSWSSPSGGGIVGAFALNTPVLAVTPTSLSFSGVAGGSNPAAAALNVTNGGGGTLTFTAASDSGWLTVSPVSGTAPQTLQVTASLAGLAAGTYTGHITVTATGAQGSPAVIAVTLTVAATSTWSISGSVTPSTSGSGTLLTLSGASSATTIADSLGNYSFAGLANGSYTVTPSKTGYTFTPPSQTVSVNGANIISLNFAAQAATTNTLVMDAKVSADSKTASTSIATSAFSTTSGNELLLAFISTDYISGSNTTVTKVTGGGLTWALVVRTNAQSGTAEIWRAFSPTVLTNVTVTATVSQSVLSSITVMSFSGVDTSGTYGSGAIGATASKSASSGAPTASVVTTRNGSWVFGVGNDYDNAIARTVGSGQTLVHQDLTTTGDTYWVQMENAPTPLSGTTVTINDTAPTTDQYNLSVVEVLP
ncbi:MAG TPA: N,N-dimethylformamidase beta subunit family domain-containing protein [Acidisarcina sp.]|nr:N,N-dimethylformamidase beta subunit family domain-containing protein [Acidisarcina sp.]